MKHRLWGMIVFGLLVLGVSGGMAQSPSFSLDHWVYSFLDRLKAKRLLPALFPNTKPYTRYQIAKALLPVIQNSQAADLTRVERQQLAFLQYELREEFDRLGMEASESEDSHLRFLTRRVPLVRRIFPFFFANGRDLAEISSGDFRLFLNPVFHLHSRRRDYDYRPDRTIVRERHGIWFWGWWGKWVQFYFHFRDGTEWGGEYPAYNPNWSFERVGLANARGRLVFFDETQSGIYVGRPDRWMMLGRERNRWGPGRTGALALSDWATAYDQLKMQFAWKKVLYTWVMGVLKSYPPIAARTYETGTTTRIVHASKFFVGHRLEFAPVSWAVVGLHELVVWGERGLEIGYLNPLNFYWSAEHNLSDQDNAVMGLDVTLYPGWKLKLYGEIFLDDLQTGRLGTGYYGNKWAFLVGGSRYDLFGLANLDLHGEWVRIRPFVYSHRFPINIYKHFTSTLGHWAGPNSEVVDMALRWQPRRRLFLQGNWQLYRHGANRPGENAGGDMNQPHTINDPLYVRFLGGILEETQTTGLEMRYEILRNAFLTFALQWISRKNDPIGEERRGSGKEVQVFLGVSWNE